MEFDIKAHRRARLQQLIEANGGVRAVFAARYGVKPQRLTNLLTYDDNRFGDRAARKLEQDLKGLLGSEAAYFFDEGFPGFEKPAPMPNHLHLMPVPTRQARVADSMCEGDTESIGDLGAWVSLFINASEVQKGMLFAAAEAIMRKKELTPVSSGTAE